MRTRHAVDRGHGPVEGGEHRGERHEDDGAAGPPRRAGAARRGWHRTPVPPTRPWRRRRATSPATGVALAPAATAARQRAVNPSRPTTPSTTPSASSGTARSDGGRSATRGDARTNHEAGPRGDLLPAPGKASVRRGHSTIAPSANATATASPTPTRFPRAPPRGPRTRSRPTRRVGGRRASRHRPRTPRPRRPSRPGPGCSGLAQSGDGRARPWRPGRRGGHSRPSPPVPGRGEAVATGVTGSGSRLRRTADIVAPPPVRCGHGRSLRPQRGAWRPRGPQAGHDADEVGEHDDRDRDQRGADDRHDRDGDHARAARPARSSSSARRPARAESPRSGPPPPPSSPATAPSARPVPR